MIYQTVSIVGNSSYTAKAWMKAAGMSWYPGSAQQAALIVQQMDAGGIVIDEHKEYLTDLTNWQQLVYSFTSLPGARFVRVGGWANMIGQMSSLDDRAIIDSVELNGAAGAPMPSLYGVVKSGADRLPGSLVKLYTGGYPGATATTYKTNADDVGAWAFNPAAGPYTARAAKAGYFAQRKMVTSPNPLGYVFDLVPVGQNIVTNPGFDDSPYVGWQEEIDPAGGSDCMRRSEVILIKMDVNVNYGTPTENYSASGDDAICFIEAGSGAPSGLWLNQRIAVRGNTPYTAKLKTRIAIRPGFDTNWGDTTDAQKAGLLIREYNSAGSYTEHPLVTSSEVLNWETLETSFTTKSDTVAIGIGPYAWMTEVSGTTTAPSGWARVIFDDLELNGPAGAYGLTGTVINGGAPIAGATVTATDVDLETSTVCTTNSSGQYSAPVAYGHTYNIRADKPGYYPQSKSNVAISGSIVADFKLLSAAGNLIINPGFDEPAGYNIGWVDATGFDMKPESQTAQFGQTYYWSGEQAAFLRTYTGAYGRRMYQDVPVLPNSDYSASVMFRGAYGIPYEPSTMWGDPSQYGGLFIQELDASKNPVAGIDEHFAKAGGDAGITAANRNTWLPVDLSLTTSGTTAFLRIGGYAYLVQSYDATLDRAIFDQFALTGTQVPGIGLGDLKKLADGSVVRITGKVVTGNFAGFFYIEEPDRSNGIRVEGFALPGTVVDVYGTLSTVNGERAIINNAITPGGQTDIPDPLGTKGGSIQVGLSPVGMYMKVWGRVQDADAGLGTFYLTDGGAVTLKVYGSASNGEYVAVAGCLGAETIVVDDNKVVIPVMRATQVTPYTEE